MKTKFLGIVLALLLLIGLFAVRSNQTGTKSETAISDADHSILGSSPANKSENKILNMAQSTSRWLGLRTREQELSAQGSKDLTTLSIHELKKEAQDFSDAELLSRISKIETEIKSRHFIEKANQDQLSQTEREQLRILIREQVALKSTLIDRKLDRLQESL